MDIYRTGKGGKDYSFSSSSFLPQKCDASSSFPENVKIADRNGGRSVGRSVGGRTESTPSALGTKSHFLVFREKGGRGENQSAAIVNNKWKEKSRLRKKRSLLLRLLNINTGRQGGQRRKLAEFFPNHRCSHIIGQVFHEFTKRK